MLATKINLLKQKDLQDLGTWAFVGTSTRCVWMNARQAGPFVPHYYSANLDKSLAGCRTLLPSQVLC
jgi:hypothetical protein